MEEYDYFDHRLWGLYRVFRDTTPARGSKITTARLREMAEAMGVSTENVDLRMVIHEYGKRY
jgi:hypothetical protein